MNKLAILLSDKLNELFRDGKTEDVPAHIKLILYNKLTNPQLYFFENLLENSYENNTIKG